MAQVGRMGLALGHAWTPQTDAIAIDTALDEASGPLRLLIGDRISLTLSLAARAARVRMATTSLLRVLAHLAANARDAMPDGGHLRVETLTLIVDAADATLLGRIRPGRYVRLIVSDTGDALSLEACNRAFGMSCDADADTEGVDVRRALARTLVEAHGGHLAADQRVSGGTDVYVYLPAAPPERVAAIARAV